MNRMGRLFDFWERAETGERVEEKDFTLRSFWKHLKALTQHYELRYDEQLIVPADDGYIDRVYAAGRDLLLRAGVYVRNTESVIRFDPAEVDEAIALIPDRVIFGDGADRVEICYRGLDPKTPPAVLGRALGPHSPEIVEKVFLSFAKEPIVDHFHLQAVMTQVAGVTVKPGSPFEMLQELKRINYARSALREAGRPDAHDGATTPAGLPAKIGFYNQEWGKRKGDSHFSHIMPHLMVDYEQLIVAFLTHLHGLPLTTSGIGLVKGMAGSPPMCAVTIVAQALASVLLFQTQSHVSGAVDNDYQSETSREALWAGITGSAAVNKHIPIPSLRTVPGSIMTAGLACMEHFWEVAASTTGTAVVGCVVQGGTGRRSSETDFAAGISARCAGEVGRAAIGIPRHRANELVNQFLAKYEARVKDQTLHLLGKRFQECYDLDRVRPTDEHERVYQQFKEEAVKLGLPM